METGLSGSKGSSGRGDIPRGPISGRISSVEKGSKRSIDVANRLYGILHGQGKDSEKYSARSAVLSGKPVTESSNRTKASRRKVDMKLLLEQSSANGFEGLQLDSVDPDFVFPGSHREESSTEIVRIEQDGCVWPKNAVSVDGVMSVDPGALTPALGTQAVKCVTADGTTSTAVRSSLPCSVDPTVKRLTSTVDDVDSDRGIAARLVDSPSVFKELLYWKEECARKETKVLNGYKDQSGCSTPSTDADSQAIETELSHFAGSYGMNDASYEIMPQEDVSIFPCLLNPYLPSSTYTLLEPLEESLAYSQFSPSADSQLARRSQRHIPPGDGTFRIFKNEMCARQEAPRIDTITITTATAITITSEPKDALEDTVTSKKDEIAGGVDLDCDVMLQPMLKLLNKHQKNVVAVLVNCIIRRKTYVMDAAIELCKIFQSNRKSIRMKSKDKKGRKKDEPSKKEVKSEIEAVSTTLEKMMKNRLGTSSAVGQAVSSSCLLLVYLQLESQRELNTVKVSAGNDNSRPNVHDKQLNNSAKIMAGRANDMISSSFDRLALTALSPYVLHEDVQWLTFSSSQKNKNVSNTSTDSSSSHDPRECSGVADGTPCPDINDVILSPKTRKRKSTPEKNSVTSSGRELKRKKSKEDTVPLVGDLSPKSKREYLWDIIQSLKVHYADVKAVSPVLKKLGRSYRPSAARPNLQYGASESDSSPSHSPGGMDSPDPIDAGMQTGDVRSVKDITVGRSLLGTGDLSTRSRIRIKIDRKKPMIPLSAAGAALLLVKSDTLTSTLPDPSDIVPANAVTVGVSTKKGAGLKRTNSIVNVHKVSVGQRTGRGKGKSVRTSLNPDPNINSMLNYIKRKDTNGSAVQDSNSSAQSCLCLCQPSDSQKLCANCAAKQTKSGVDSRKDLENVSNVRRSARKRDREDSDRWQGPLTQLKNACNVHEVEDTPYEKVRARQTKSNVLASAMRALRGGNTTISEAAREEEPRPAIGVGQGDERGLDEWKSIATRGSAKKSRRPQSMEATEVFTSGPLASGGSGKRSSARNMISSPFFLPAVDLLLSEYNDSEHDGKDDGNLFEQGSAAAALGMEVLSQRRRRSPRLIRLPPQSQFSSSSSGRVTIPVGAINRTVGPAIGSFTRSDHFYDPSQGFDLTDEGHEAETETDGWQHSLVQMQSTPMAAPKRRLER